MYNIIKSLIYFFLRSLMEASFSFSYRNIIVTGYDKIKHLKPTLFVSNHQNTFMDGFVLIKVARNISPNILTRADIFKSKWAAIALDIIRLIPIYRKKDNMGSVAQNNEIFKKCISLFKNGEPLLIFPEGNHAMERFLRPLQKGPARIAFQAEEESDFQLGLNVSPFGIQYENHPKRWYDLHVHFGNAFQVQEFQEVFAENPTIAQKQFTDKIQQDISAEMIDIEWHSEYKFMEQVRLLLKPYAMTWADSKKSSVHAENEVVNILGNRLQKNADKMTVLKSRVENYFEKVKNSNLTEDFVAKKPTVVGFLQKTVGVLLGLPFWFIAKLINFVPEYIVEKKIIAPVKDITWHISLRTGASMFIYPIFYLTIFVIMGVSLGWLIAGIVVFTFPLLSVVMYETEYHFKKLKNSIILFQKQEILKEEQELVQEFRSIMS
ncbi:1-acyl-sn-glycerol-3-phosphate acyltransferase [Marivirga sericea]|uniref:1-acyl-sn-glycerol-3-phosphate acyltransferase n=1 Tax=Marivirga sericea TaxID=1028 RepID=A0A1X7KP61_9BACT|nr:1-acyl-sn-glycerol-3-phosphate acyltransferase [Marivirga sericea]SMG43011.1 1-acyl-sn-glycerol-3-phosphate acyltransferase [Marivirga sericea]